MYIKIQNPERSSILLSLFRVGFFLVVLLAIVIFMIISGNITSFWNEIITFLKEVKQEDGLLLYIFYVFCMFMGPVLLIVSLIISIREWHQMKPQWNSPLAVQALRFGREGITIYTQQNTYLLPYEQTTLRVASEIRTIHIRRGGTYAALTAFTLTFSQDNNSFKVRHKSTSQLSYQTNPLLFKLADLHPHMKDLSFEFILSVPEDKDQQKLAEFLQKQVENQIHYGMHIQYRSYLVLVVFGILFTGFGIWVLKSIFAFNLSTYLLLVQAGLFSFGLIMLGTGLTFIYKTVRDVYIAHKLKQVSHY